MFHDKTDRFHFTHGRCKETKNPLVEIRDENNRIITLTYTDWIELVKVLPSVKRDSNMSILKLIGDVVGL